jgi:PBP1b-binding outer membrane lipoprotein LpoB
MKKIISLALIALTSLVFAGCQWFQPAAEEETTEPQTATSTATITIKDEEKADVTGTITIEPSETEVVAEEEEVVEPADGPGFGMESEPTSADEEV